MYLPFLNNRDTPVQFPLYIPVGWFMEFMRQFSAWARIWSKPRLRCTRCGDIYVSLVSTIHQGDYCHSSQQHAAQECLQYVEGDLDALEFPNERLEYVTTDETLPYALAKAQVLDHEVDDTTSYVFGLARESTHNTPYSTYLYLAPTRKNTIDVFYARLGILSDSEYNTSTKFSPPPLPCL